MTNINYITGEKFKNYIYPNESFQYFDTHDYWNIFKFIVHVKKNPDTIYTLITHNSDYSVSKCLSSMGLYIEKIPYNLRWFSQNVDVYHNQIRSIPIGLENPEWHKEIQKIKKIEIYRKYKVRNLENLACAYFNTETNSRRSSIIDYFKQFDWCDCKNVKNGTSYEEYLNKLITCTFCICPEGNGIDTHRIWEALYLGCVPVVEDSINISFYKNLPIFVCENFQDITKQELIEAYHNFNINLYSFELKQLSMDYWTNEICNM